MLSDSVMKQLDMIASGLTGVKEVEILTYMRCTCVGSCTDTCADGPSNGKEPWN